MTVLLAEVSRKRPMPSQIFERLHGLPIKNPPASNISTDPVCWTRSCSRGFPSNLPPSLMNRQHENGAFVLAVDLPSGISTDTGEVARRCRPCRPDRHLWQLQAAAHGSIVRTALRQNRL